MMNLNRKYRPKTFEEFMGNEEIVRDIKSLLKVGDMPHLMFVGSHGIGKTTMALLVARYYLNKPINLNTADGAADFTCINASDERGIDTVREFINIRAKTRSETFDENGIRKKRIFVLEEADSLTRDAQHALRPVVEINEDRCIFIFLLNHIEGIKEPALISRCATFFFKRPNIEACMDYFKTCANGEGVEFESEELIYDIASYYKGDLRHMLNDCLEPLRGFDKVIDYDDVWKLKQTNKTAAKRVSESINPRKTFFEIFKTEALDTRQFLEEYYDLLGDKSLEVSKGFAIVDSRLRDNCSEIVQMNYLFSLIGK